MLKLSISLLIVALASPSALGLAIRQDPLSSDTLLPSDPAGVTITSTAPGDDATVYITGPATTISDTATNYPTSGSFATTTALSTTLPTIVSGSAPLPTSTDVPSATCSKTYSVVEGDTCFGISAAQQVPSSQLAQLNPDVNSDCTNLQIGQELCLEDSTTFCSTPYTVVEGDYCEKIVDTYSIQLESFYGLNPSIDATCSNLLSGMTICLDSSNTTVPVPTDTAIPTSIPATSDPLGGTSTAISSGSGIIPTATSSDIFSSSFSSALPSFTTSGINPGASVV